MVTFATKDTTALAMLCYEAPSWYKSWVLACLVNPVTISSYLLFVIYCSLVYDNISHTAPSQLFNFCPSSTQYWLLCQWFHWQGNHCDSLCISGLIIHQQVAFPFIIHLPLFFQDTCMMVILLIYHKEAACWSMSGTIMSSLSWLWPGQEGRTLKWRWWIHASRNSKPTSYCM